MPTLTPALCAAMHNGSLSRCRQFECHNALWDHSHSTVLVIAHRLTTIRDADKIVVLKDGVKLEEGDHKFLLREHPDGIYAGLVKL